MPGASRGSDGLAGPPVARRNPRRHGNLDIVVAAPTGVATTSERAAVAGVRCPRGRMAALLRRDFGN